MSLNYVEISGTFDDGTGTPLSGTAVFTPNVSVYAGGIPQVTPDTPVTAQITAGSLRSGSGGTLQLLATDNSGLSFLGQTGFFYWTVAITIAGEILAPWSFFLPHGTLGNGPVDLYSLANTAASGSGGVASVTAGDASVIIGGTGTAPTVETGTLDQIASLHHAAADVTVNSHKIVNLASGSSAADAVAYGQLGSAAFQPASAFDAAGAATAAQGNAEAYADTSKLAKSANLSDLASASTARTNLGLGSAATQASSAFDAAGAALAAQSAAEAYSSPSTTLGDLIYGGPSGVPARLAGNSAAVREFLISQGTGSAAQAPALGPLTAADIGAAFPWQFYVDDPKYGAKGDGRIINDATIGSGNLSQLTSASAAFTNADTGKTIMINGAQGNNAQPLITTITYVSATTVTLARAASGAITNASAVYGSDDSTAVQAAVTSAGNYAMAAGGPFHAQVIFGDKLYCLATPPPVTSGIAGSTTCQVRIPAPDVNGTTRKLVIELLGTGCADANMYFDAAVPNIQGSALISMCIPPYTSGTNPYPSVVGFQYAADGSLAGGFANTKCYVDGLTVVIPYLAPQGGYDFRFLGGAGGGRFGAMAFGAPSAGNYNNLADLLNLSGQQNGSSVGLFCPLTGNNDDCTFLSFTNQGFVFGVNVTEHCSFQRLSSVYDIVGIQCVGGGAHIGASVGYASVEQVFAALQYTGTSPFPFFGIIDTEQVSTWHVQDTQQALYGSLKVHTNTGAPAVLGGSNCEIIWDAQPRSVQGAPSYTLGTAFQNPWWHHVTITLAGGTVTGISIGPTSGTLTSLGITSGTFRLPSGWWLSIAGSVKPATFIAVPD